MPTLGVYRTTVTMKALTGIKVNSQVPMQARNNAAAIGPERENANQDGAADRPPPSCVAACSACLRRSRRQPGGGDAGKDGGAEPLVGVELRQAVRPRVQVHCRHLTIARHMLLRFKLSILLPRQS